MLLLLLKLRIADLFSSLLNPKHKSRSLLVLLLLGVVFLFVAASFFIFFFVIFIVIALSLAEADAAYAYFGLGGAIALLIMLLGSVIYTKNQLYVANDNEFLLAMPVPPRLILLSRLLILLFVNFLLELIVAVPFAVAWLLVAGVTLAGVLSTLLTFLLLPIFSLSLSALLAYLIHRIEKRLRKKSFITLLIALILFAAYYVFVFGYADVLESLEADITPLINLVDAAVPIAVLGRAMLGSLPDLLLVLVPFLLIPLLVLAHLSRTYLKTVLENRGERRALYRERTHRTRNPLWALTVRELCHLTSSAGYMLNTGMGLIILLVPPVFLLFRGELIPMLTELHPVVPRLLLPAVSLISAAIASISYFSAVTVSLEGRTLWIVQTAPVPTRTVLLSKLLYHLVPTVPIATVATVLYTVALRATLFDGLALWISIIAFLLFSTTFGLTMNLLFPKLEWKNELIPIKQGGASALAMFGCTAAAGIVGMVGVLLALLLPPALALLLASLLYLAGAAGLFFYILHGGVRRFESL